MSEVNTWYYITKITVIISICCVILIALIVYYEDRLEMFSTCDYWDSAPNDVYKMMVYLSEVKGDEVWFPLCPTAPGPLHGGWRVADGVTFPVTGEYVFELKSNVIVWATLLQEWNSTTGEWGPFQK